MLDLPWRYKLVIPFCIVIPMISNYQGSTEVVFSFPINLLVDSIELGMLFYLYIILLGIYCTNTINIYAGINGLEVGQSIIAAASLLIIFGIKAYKESELKDNYYYSIYLLVTFIGKFQLTQAHLLLYSRKTPTLLRFSSVTRTVTSLALCYV